SPVPSCRRAPAAARRGRRPPAGRSWFSRLRAARAPIRGCSWEEVYPRPRVTYSSGANWAVWVISAATAGPIGTNDATARREHRVRLPPAGRPAAGPVDPADRAAVAELRPAGPARGDEEAGRA